MDPDENLREQLEIASRSVESEHDDLRRLAELVESLHEWITRGGVRPTAWGEER